jgi:hypothetical protein
MFLSLRVERRERVIKKERGNIKLLTNHKKCMILVSQC